MNVPSCLARLSLIMMMKYLKNVTYFNYMESVSKYKVFVGFFHFYPNLLQSDQNEKEKKSKKLKAEEAPKEEKDSKTKKPKEEKGKKSDNGTNVEVAPEEKIESYEITTKTKDEREHTLKISSWNVAGLRAWVKKDGLKYIKDEDADIICFQETKCIESELPSDVNKFKVGKTLFGENKNGYHMYWCNGEKKGYSGVALWSKIKPISVTYGMNVIEHDNEGRLITAEYEKFYLLTTYVPNSGNKLVRLDYRRTWNTALKDYINNLNNMKPVILCGDLNVAHNEIDLANPKSNRKNAGFTDEEREDFSTFLNEGYIDTFRHLNPEKTGAYTYWTYMGNARARNTGWRLDYYVIAKSLESSLCDNVIRSSIKGSDHCPIVLTLGI